MVGQRVDWLLRDRDSASSGESSVKYEPSGDVVHQRRWMKPIPKDVTVWVRDHCAGVWVKCGSRAVRKTNCAEPANRQGTGVN